MAKINYYIPNIAQIEAKDLPFHPNSIRIKKIHLTQQVLEFNLKSIRAFDKSSWIY